MTRAADSTAVASTVTACSRQGRLLASDCRITITPMELEHHRLCVVFLGAGPLITGGGSGYAAIFKLAHAEGALYGTELGSVTLKRIGFFCFPIASEHSNTHSLTVGLPRDRGLGRCVTSATPVSGRGITGGGSGYAALLAHAG
jgi:hypothetical protein